MPSRCGWRPERRQTETARQVRQGRCRYRRRVLTVWAWPRTKSAVHRLTAALNVSRHFRKQEFPARYSVGPPSLSDCTFCQKQFLRRHSKPSFPSGSPVASSRAVDGQAAGVAVIGGMRTLFFLSARPSPHPSPGTPATIPSRVRKESQKRALVFGKAPALIAQSTRQDLTEATPRPIVFNGPLYCR